jgi:hypothetical protein
VTDGQVDESSASAILVVAEVLGPVFDEYTPHPKHKRNTTLPTGDFKIELQNTTNLARIIEKNSTAGERRRIFDTGE